MWSGRMIFVGHRLLRLGEEEGTSRRKAKIPQVCVCELLVSLTIPMSVYSELLVSLTIPMSVCSELLVSLTAGPGTKQGTCMF